MPVAAAVRHIAFEDLGSLGPLLADRGYTIRYYEAGIDDLAPAAASDLLVALGGPIGANDEETYPFLKDELGIIERRLKAGKPTLGICLGAQLMARVLGAKVYPATVKEIGWKPLILTAEGKNSPLGHMGETEPVLHWHGDMFDIPKGASLLASTPQGPHQAFAAGPNVLGLQFHAEALGGRIEQWLIGHTGELARSGIDIPRLREDARRWSGSLAVRSRALFEEWLSGLAF